MSHRYVRFYSKVSPEHCTLFVIEKFDVTKLFKILCIFLTDLETSSTKRSAAQQMFGAMFALYGDGLLENLPVLQIRFVSLNKNLIGLHRQIHVLL